MTATALITPLLTTLVRWAVNQPPILAVALVSIAPDLWLILVFGEPLGKVLHLTFSCTPSPRRLAVV